MALTNLAAVKLHLNIQTSDTSQDAVLTRHINAASLMVERFIDRKVLKATHTEFQDGRGSDRIVLRHWPADKPSELWSDPSGKFVDPACQYNADEYELELTSDGGIGVILLAGRRFPKGSRSIKIVYQAGYDQVPADMEEATIWTVEFLYDMRSDRRIGVSSKSKNNENTSFRGELPEVVQNMLVPYRRSEFAMASVAVQNQ